MELSPAARADRDDDGHLPHEPPASPARRPRVLRDPQPDRGDRSAPHLAHDPLRAPGVHRRGGSRAGARARDQRRQPHALRGRLLGLGLSRGRRGERPAGGRALRGAPVMYVGTIRHRRFAVRSHEFSYRIALAYRDLDEVGRGFLSRAQVCALIPGFDGEIRLLSSLRGFNPVSFYYCFEDGALRWIVAEVTNTPWGERHAYVLPAGGGPLEKALHVSPFMAMNHAYEVRATTPGETLSMHIES